MKTRKSAVRFLGGVVLSLAVCLVMVGTAFAASGAYVYQTVNGVSVNGHAEIYESGQYSMMGKVQINAGSSRPAGHLGASVYTLRNGSIVASYGPAYSGSSTNSFSAYAGTEKVGTSSFRSYGNIYIYNSSTGKYQVYNVPSSPTITGIAPRSVFENEYVADAEYAINENGMEYGSILTAEYTGYNPELVSVVATNGIEGYAYGSELFIEPTTLEDAIAVSQETHTKIVPVYDPDGVTKIGEFVTRYGGDGHYQ